MSAVAVATEITSHYTKIPNHLLDYRKTPYLNSNQRFVYFVLVRHSYGYHKDTCKCSLEYLKSYTGSCAGTIRSSIKHLKALQLIEQLEPWHFRVKLPPQIPVKEIPKTEPIPEPIDKICNDVLQNLSPDTGTNQANIEHHEFSKDKEIKTLSTNKSESLNHASLLFDLGFTCLSGITDLALRAALQLMPIFAVLRVILTIISQYSISGAKKSVDILNPSALLHYALKAKNGFIALSDKELVDHWRYAIHRTYSHLVLTQKDTPIKQLLQLVKYDEWLRNNPQLTLEQLYYSYYEMCPAVSRLNSFLQLYAIPEPPKILTMPDLNRIGNPEEPC